MELLCNGPGMPWPTIFRHIQQNSRFFGAAGDVVSWLKVGEVWTFQRARIHQDSRFGLPQETAPGKLSGTRIAYHGILWNLNILVALLIAIAIRKELVRLCEAELERRAFMSPCSRRVASNFAKL